MMRKIDEASSIHFSAENVGLTYSMNADLDTNAENEKIWWVAFNCTEARTNRDGVGKKRIKGGGEKRGEKKKRRLR